MHNLIDFLSYVPRQIVYHYTNERALISIVETRAIWATNILDMIDQRELRHGIELAERELTRIQQVHALQYDSLFNTVAGLLGAISQDNNVGIYVASFCEDGGDRESQWRDYADSGRGLSIGLDFADEDARRKLRALQPSTRFGFHFAKCEYGQHTQERFVRESINEMIGTYGRLVAYGRAESAELLASLEFAERYLFRLAPRLKSSDLESEQECRLVVRVSADDSGVLRRERKGSCIRFVEFKLANDTDQLILPEIIVGPCNLGQMSTELSIRDLLSRHHADCQLIRSSNTVYPCSQS